MDIEFLKAFLVQFVGGSVAPTVGATGSFLQALS